MIPLRLRSSAVCLVAVVALTATATAPVSTAPPLPKPVFMIAPMKAGDDWTQFFNKLEDFSSLNGVDIRMSEKKYMEEPCDGSPECDVVTIEKASERAYNFKLRNPSRAHMPLFACSTCEINTPVEQCMPSAQTTFAGFLIRHNRCHQDQARCNELPCSQ